jgi:hypothetical protein
VKNIFSNYYNVRGRKKKPLKVFTKDIYPSLCLSFPLRKRERERERERM